MTPPVVRPTGSSDLTGIRFQELGDSLFGPRRSVWEVVEVRPGSPAHALIRDTAGRLPDKTLGIAVLLNRARYRRLQERRPGGS